MASNYQPPPDAGWQAAYATDLGAYKCYHYGTAAGTAQVSIYPGFLSHIQINQRSASGTIVVYDNGTGQLTGTGLSGTAGSVIANINLGTQTNTDNPPYYQYKIATRTGISICWSGGLDLTVAALP